MLGAGRVVAIDRQPERLRMWRSGSAGTINYEQQDVFETLQAMTGGHGPDACIDARRPRGSRHQLRLLLRQGEDRGVPRDRSHLSALRQAINCCRKGGTVSIPARVRRIPRQGAAGAAFHKGLTMAGMGQTT